MKKSPIQINMSDEVSVNNFNKLKKKLGLRNNVELLRFLVKDALEKKQ